MKLRNKKTGEVIESKELLTDEFIIDLFSTDYDSFCTKLHKIIEEWEDYEEQKEWYWFIEDNGIIQRSCHYEDLHPTLDKARKEIGNYFDTREQAEKAVEKLKAIQRLKSYYIKFKLDFVKNKIDFTYRIDGTLHSSIDEERIIFEDLALLFGGEE